MSSVQSDNGQDFDLNLAPIIDCFTVLITYLLVSASFISLIVLDVGIATQSPSDQSKPLAIPPYNLMVQLKAEHAVVLNVTGGPKNVDLKFPVQSKKSGAWDPDTLTEKLTELQKSYPDVKEATLSAEPVVIYREVVQVVETMKKLIGKVYLSG